MSTSWMEFVRALPENPLRPPDWRWKLAARLYEQRRLAPRWRSDRWLKQAIRVHQHRRARGRTAVQDQCALAEALRIHQSSDPMIRDMIQARLLAGQGPVDIAAKCGTLDHVIVAYEQLFFNVTDRLECSSYVARIIEPELIIGTGDSTRAAVVKRLAYMGGPSIVELVIPYLDEAYTPARSGMTPTEARLSHLISRTIDLALLPVCPESERFTPRVLELIDRLDHAERDRIVVINARVNSMPYLDTALFENGLFHAHGEMVEHDGWLGPDPSVIPILKPTNRQEDSLDEVVHWFAAVG